MTLPATFGCGQSFCATVNLSLSASDPDDAPGQITISCNTPNGTPLSYTATAGTGLITCQAKDAAGNLSQQVQFTVTVTVPPPSFQNVPAPISTNATSTMGAVVTFIPPTASDVGGQPDVVTCDHLSGITYPITTTTVICSAAVVRNDSNGIPYTYVTGSVAFAITVTPPSATPPPQTLPPPPAGGGGGAGGSGGAGGGGGGGGGFGGSRDTTPPTIVAHPNIRVAATTSRGAVVSFEVSATDPDDDRAHVVIACTPATGTTFPLAAHAASKISTVTCTARDAAGNAAAPMAFVITVEGAHDQLLALERQVRAQPQLTREMRTRLVGQLKTADQLVVQGVGERADERLATFMTAAAHSGAPSAARRRWAAQAAQIIAVLA